MLTAITSRFSADFSCPPSDGGMFFWVTGPEGFGMIQLYYRCIENNVAFVPGKFFFTDDSEGIETMRLNYIMADERTIDHTNGKIADVIKTM
jgi:2-aminoadipate transaminase